VHIMDQRMINIGFGNAVVAGRILAVVNPKSSPIKKLKDEAKAQKKLIDVTVKRIKHLKKLLMPTLLG